MKRGWLAAMVCGLAVAACSRSADADTGTAGSDDTALANDGGDTSGDGAATDETTATGDSGGGEETSDTASEGDATGDTGVGDTAPLADSTEPADSEGGAPDADDASVDTAPETSDIAAADTDAADTGTETDAPDDSGADTGVETDTAPSATVEVGTGDALFEPITPTTVLPCIAGVQGWYHIWASVRVTGVELPDVEVYLHGTVGTTELAAAVFTPAPEAWTEEPDGAATMAGLTNFISFSVDPFGFDGSPITVTAEVHDHRGFTVTDTKSAFYSCPAEVP